MKILYAIQGTGNGHVSRARDIIPHLQKHGELDILISGTQADVSLEQALKYKLHGFSFVFGKKGGVDRWETIKLMNLPQLRRDIRSIMLDDYNLIVNDFEPVTAWACRFKDLPIVGLSHQASFLSKKTPRPAHFLPQWAEWVLKYYAPVHDAVSFHFKPYDTNINTPVIRQEIRALVPEDRGHYTVYLPAYDDAVLINHFNRFPSVRWELFSKHSRQGYQLRNITVSPVNNEAYLLSLASCAGLLTGGGFEGPAEALFLGKKVLVIPMTDQWEQQCNAEALRLMGLPVVNRICSDFTTQLGRWIQSEERVTVNYPDQTEAIVEALVNQYARY